MRLALGLTAIGVVLGVVAAVGFFSSPSDSGNPERVEASLTDGSVVSAAPATHAIASITTDPEPLWVANESSLLTDQSGTEKAPPERLVIDALGIDAPVGAYGVDTDGQMAVPDNITEVGWYRHGPSPGDRGSAVLAAHVDLRGPGRGLFYDLDELDVGETVVVFYADGESMDFQVMARSTYLKSELPLEAIFSREGDPVLTLITCGGGFSRSAGSYDSNVVVYAVPAGQVESQELEKS
jgi:LPXTG-site transpeptidase (sortase) family protein